MEDTLSCFEEYKNLYYTPVCPDFVENVFLCGEIWGAYLNNNIVACCYYFPLNSSFFATSDFCTALKLFIPNAEKYYFMGYVGMKKELVSTDRNCRDMPTADGLWQAFANVAQMQAFRRGLKYTVHCAAVKVGCPLETVFTAGYRLIKMRGLGNLVVHYIFAKAVVADEDIYETDRTNPPVTADISDTKKVSALLESGYCGVDFDNKSLYLCRLVTD